jgi:Icc protein
VADPSTETVDNSIRIVQITDTHLYADPSGTLLGLNTRHCLDQVVELLGRAPPPDMIVASGDLSHDGSSESYQYLRECFARIGAPVYCLPGNHDEVDALRRNLNSDCYHSVRNKPLGGWQQVFLDSTIAGSEGGHLDGEELGALEAALTAGGTAPAVIWLHHQPVPIGSRWLDTMAVDNARELFTVVDRYPQVRAVIWGHVHQDFDRYRNGVRLLATPSTCLQFKPGSEDFAIDLVPPGYRWLELRADGGFETGVERLDRIPGEVDPGARGY